MTSLGLWNELEKTDPKYTKQFTRGGGFKGTAINGTYITKRLTEKFGPNGVGWRFVLEDEQIHEGHTLKSGDKAKVHVVRGHIEYLFEGGWAKTSPQFGQTMLVDENKYGPFTDEEAPKKSITDCVSKCAVLLGVAADVHLGLFDDNKYVSDRKREEAAKYSDTQDKKGDGAGNPDIAPHVKKENGKYTGMTGPIGTKTALQAKLREISHDLEGMTDVDELEDFLRDNALVIEQVKRDMPPWWDKVKTKENDFEGLKQRIDAKRFQLKQMDELTTLAAG